LLLHIFAVILFLFRALREFASFGVTLVLAATPEIVLLGPDFLQIFLCPSVGGPNTIVCLCRDLLAGLARGRLDRKIVWHWFSIRPVEPLLTKNKARRRASP
jgi:hypothetical protein